MRTSLLGGLVSALVAYHQGVTAQDVITDDTFFYGQSPPVYPSPPGTGTGNWASAYAKADDFVSQLTLEEKVSLTGGVSADTSCSGTIPAIERLGFPGLCLSDAGNGVRTTDFVNAWPAGISVGASWNRALTKKRASGMGGEFRKKGVNVALGPVVGPLGRIASNGRNWEGFSVDPYLCGALAADTVGALQGEGVAASTKHFIGNEQETNRNPTWGETPKIEALSSNIDDKTMHELYLWPFQDAVKAGTASIMCSYQRVNNSYGCANSKTQNGLLKGELGFQGHIVSDWGAQHAGVATALAGLDIVMPSALSYWGPNLTEAVRNGSVPEARIDDMATRVMATWYQLGQDVDFPPRGVGMPADLSLPHERVIATSPDSKDVLLQGAIEGHVLVKNANNALPFKSPKLLSVFGYSAKAYSGQTPDAFGWNGGNQAMSPIVDYFENEDGNMAPGQIARNGTLISGGGSGANMPAYMSAPFDALSERAWQDGTHLWWDFVSGNPTVDSASDACLVIGNAFATEGYDRPGLRDEFTDNLVINVAAQCANTIVVLHNAGVRLVDTWADNPNVTAIIFAHTPGQDSGRALTQILYGDVSPSGKMPYSVPRTEADYGPLANETRPDGIYALFPQSDFDEGVFVDYRAFDRDDIDVRYEFGFGLGYAEFGFEGLEISSAASSGELSPYPTGDIVEGGHEDLWDVLATVGVTVSNISPASSSVTTSTGGRVTTAEVAQLYVGIPGEGQPVRQLRGFEKVFLGPGESKKVEFPLTRRDLSVWDVGAQKWLLQAGGEDFGVWVGSSSRDLKLEGTLTL